jgi:serine protease inhibitor
MKPRSTVVSDAVSALFPLTRALLDTRPRDTNFFCSPASLQAALCAAALAATPGSDTASQLLRLFGPPDTTAADDAVAATRASGMTSSRAGLHVANALFVVRDSAVWPAFAEAMQTNLGAQVWAARSAKDVNDWCATETHGAITELVHGSEIDADTVLLLVNAVLFHGEWAFPFDAAATRDGLWAAGTASETRVPFMHHLFESWREPVHAGMVGDYTAQAVCVPYSTPGMEAWFLLPFEKGDEALHAVGAALPQLWLHVSPLRARPACDVELTCPRFAVDTGALDIRPALEALGVTAPFFEKGGLLAATNDPAVVITSVLQRVTCAVDEAGTVAAACTSVTARHTCAHLNIVLDRPFWMAIVMRSEESAQVAVPLFIGRVVRPTA